MNYDSVGSPAIITTDDASNVRTRTRAFCNTCQKSVRLMRVTDVSEFPKTTHAGVFALADKQELHRLHNRKGIVMLLSIPVSAFENCDRHLLVGAFEMIGKL